MRNSLKGQPAQWQQNLDVMQSHDVSAGAKVLGLLLTPVATFGVLVSLWQQSVTCNGRVGTLGWDTWVSGVHVLYILSQPKVGLEGVVIGVRSG